MYNLQYTLCSMDEIKCTIQSFLFLFLGNVVLENLRVKENALVSMFCKILSLITFDLLF